MNVLIDLNIILDVILQRQPWLAEATAVWDAHHKGRVRGHLVATSLTNLFYIARRFVGGDDARLAVRDCLQTFPVLAVDGPLLRQADALAGTDFEDNVQLAAAIAFQLDAIVTRDPRGFAGAAVAVLSPAQLLARLAQGASPQP
jgi:predicted nucleic acid-binding protein